MFCAWDHARSVSPISFHNIASRVFVSRDLPVWVYLQARHRSGQGLSCNVNRKKFPRDKENENLPILNRDFRVKISPSLEKQDILNFFRVRRMVFNKYLYVSSCELSNGNF